MAIFFPVAIPNRIRSLLRRSSDMLVSLALSVPAVAALLPEETITEHVLRRLPVETDAEVVAVRPQSSASRCSSACTATRRSADPRPHRRRTARRGGPEPCRPVDTPGTDAA